MPEWRFLLRFDRSTNTHVDLVFINTGAVFGSNRRNNGLRAVILRTACSVSGKARGGK